MLKQTNREIFIIAEAGINHNGSLETAKKMVDTASKAGANAVKFQTFKTEKLVVPRLEKAQYQIKNTLARGSQFDMLKKYELSERDHEILFSYCTGKGIMFLSSPFDSESVGFLDKLGLEIFKIPSGEITNLPYLAKVGRLKKKIIMSTGMANLKEIKKALDVLIAAGSPKRNITILHCNTEYPTPYEDVNLRAMRTIRNKFKVDVGYSDHTRGIEVPIAAVAMGATVIEKHFTLDRGMEGPDHAASLEPDELGAMIRAIRNIETALGGESKRPSPSERANMPMARKSIVASKDIKKGELFSDSNIAVKRPGNGINPFRLHSVLGRPAKKDFKENETIKI